jgi:hypothetical protein
MPPTSKDPDDAGSSKHIAIVFGKLAFIIIVSKAIGGYNWELKGNPTPQIPLVERGNTFPPNSPEHPAPLEEKFCPYVF